MAGEHTGFDGPVRERDLSRDRSPWHEECGIFGIYAPGKDVARLTYYGLFALQHRGQESAGIAVADGHHIAVHKGMGLVAEVFNQDNLQALKGNLAIGHVRYSTTGASSLVNAQPLVFRYLRGMVAIAHNGNLTNAGRLRQQLGATGSIFQSSTDSEVIVNLIARYSQEPIEAALRRCQDELEGAYSLVVMTEEKLIGVRDPFGVRPLCLGKMGEAWVLASESCALDTVGADFCRDIEPGEIVVIDSQGVRSIQGRRSPHSAHCIFEYVYFARPDSILDGETVNLVRRELGRNLAREYQVAADVVIPVPDSGIAAAAGYAEAAGLPFIEGLMKNRYVGRTFIQPTQEMRDLGVRLKLNPIKSILKDKRVIIIDDSIVRGTTSRRIVEMLRQAGVREVHLLVASPPVFHPCYYGIDTSARGELIAAQYSLEDIRRHVGADSLYYLSLEGLFSSVSRGAENFCAACFSGRYPIPIPSAEEASKYSLEG
ncbi:Amidophosphoribosyl transferase [Moorella glycerini]|uniref:Amidophosphoribosyltransferase n=1 Tax=Neomoorella stamsii TaxID=1266720 RepID=A0A9X7J073_9FIRM|nr:MULTISPECIES: amidophosphoribosyltransferase [Moorella]PRR68971.1 Amidophosphoribosyltransferase precursor [Moorella stamsii]CEP67592.1 Amidophosphoribosyl transferase [Moorella glycerini]